MYTPNKGSVNVIKKCERCRVGVKYLVTCRPNYAAPPLDVCEECADILTRYEDFRLDSDDNDI